MKTIKKYNVKKEFKIHSRALYDNLEANSDQYGGWEIFTPKSSMKDFFERAGVLDIWFDKEFEEEFKVGDWVVASYGNVWWCEDAKDIIGTISSISDSYDFPYRVTSEDIRTYDADYNYAYFKDIIKATPEEIEKATVKKVTFTVGKPRVPVIITSKGVIKVKDIEFKKTDLNELIKLGRQRQSIKTYEAKITSVWVGCKEGTELTVEEIKKIETEYNKLNNAK